MKKIVIMFLLIFLCFSIFGDLSDYIPIDFDIILGAGGSLCSLTINYSSYQFNVMSGNFNTFLSIGKEFLLFIDINLGVVIEANRIESDSNLVELDLLSSIYNYDVLIGLAYLIPLQFRKKKKSSINFQIGAGLHTNTFITAPKAPDYNSSLSESLGIGFIGQFVNSFSDKFYFKIGLTGFYDFYYLLDYKKESFIDAFGFFPSVTFLYKVYSSDSK